MEAVLNGGAADVIAGASGQSAGIVLGNGVGNRFLQSLLRHGSLLFALSVLCRFFKLFVCHIISGKKFIWHCYSTLREKMLYLEKR